MAIKRLDPKAIFKVISENDSALILETSEELQTGEKNEDGTPKLKLSRYSEYMEEANFKEEKLKFKDGEKPDRFLLRPLSADEWADVNSRYIFIDSVAKKMIITNRNKMFVELFHKGYQGLESGDGSTSKPDVNEFPYPVQVEMGAIVSLIASLGKNEKK